MTLYSFIEQIMKGLEGKPIVYDKTIGSESQRLKARQRFIAEWFLQQPYELQNAIFEASSEIAYSVKSIGVFGALETVVMLMVKYGI